MNKFTIILSVALFALLTNCKKDNPEPYIGNPDCIATYIQSKVTYSKYYEEYEYDSNGNLVRETYPDTTGETEAIRYTSYTYQDGKLIAKNFFGSNNYIVNSTYEYSGNYVSQISKNSTVSYPRISNYNYDADGNLSKITTRTIDTSNNSESVTQTIYSNYINGRPGVMIGYTILNDTTIRPILKDSCIYDANMNMIKTITTSYNGYGSTYTTYTSYEAAFDMSKSYVNYKVYDRDNPNPGNKDHDLNLVTNSKTYAIYSCNIDSSALDSITPRLESESNISSVHTDVNGCLKEFSVTIHYFICNEAVNTRTVKLTY